MADCESEGWGQGLEPWGTGPAHAINDSYAKFYLSTCPVHLQQASPGEQRSGKGQNLQGTGKGCENLPRGAQSPQPETRGGESRTNHRRSQMPEVSEHIQLDYQSGMPIVRLQASPGECLQNKPPPEEHWPGQRQNWWGCILVWLFLGNILCFCCKRRNRPGRERQGRKEHPAKESRVDRKVVSDNGQRRPSPRGSRKPTRTAPSCLERSPQPGGKTGLSHGKAEKGQSQGREMSRATPPGGSLFENCICRRRRRSQLRVEGSPRKCGPKARTPPGGCSYAIVIRRHSGFDRYVTAVRPSGCGGMRRRLRGASQKGQSRSLRQPQENSPGDCQVGQPGAGCQTGKQRAHFAGCGEEWWGWVLTGNSTWGSRGPPRALHPPAPKSCHAPASARRKGSQRHSEGHRNPEPGKCADARLVPPRESLAPAYTAPRKSPRRSLVSGIFAMWLSVSTFLSSSPGRLIGAVTTAHAAVLTGVNQQQIGLAPGEYYNDDHLPEVPYHGRLALHSSSSEGSRHDRNEVVSPRDSTNRQEQLSTWQAPGVHDVHRDPHKHLTPMSDMQSDMNTKIALGADVNQDRLSMHMPGMIHDLSLCVCSHVGYKPSSRSVTCPGQRAHPNLGRSETCPGQSARNNESRLETCPGQRAHNLRRRSSTCSEQLANRSRTCSEQLFHTARSTCPGRRDQMAQSRERSASLNEELAELKFWTFSIGCKNLRDCYDKVPASCRSLDVAQSDWWHEPGITQRRDALRELTTIDIAHVVDTRCLRDMDDNSEPKHLGTHVVNMRGMCHNKNMLTLIKDVWTCIEDLLREAYKHARPGFRVDVALGFVCNSGRHRSVCISEMTTAVLHRMGIVADIDHLCESGWSHLCKRNAPCPACQFVAINKPWAPWFDWFYVEMMKCAQTRGCQHEDWWEHFNLHDVSQLPRAVLPPLPRADSRPPPPEIPKTSPGGRGEPKERQRAKSGGSPGATPRHSHAASTTAADVRHPTPDEPPTTERARHVKVEGDGSEATREAGQLCRRARGEKSPSGDWTGLPGYQPRAKSMGKKGPRNPPREGLVLSQQRQVSMGRTGPRIRPRDDDVGAHPAESPPGSRQRMSKHAIGWFMRNMERAFANMNDNQLNDVSETLNTEMEIRENAAEGPARPRGGRGRGGEAESAAAGETAGAAAADENARPRGERGASRAGRDRSRPPPGGAAATQEQEEANEPGSRARSRSKAVTRRRAQWREEHGMPPREEELQKEAEAKAAEAEQQEEEEVELGAADFGTDSPPRGAARWRHGGNKADHVPRAPEPDRPVTFDSPGVARPGEGRLRVIGDAEIPGIPGVPDLPDDDQPMARLRECFGMHERAYPPRVMKALRDEMEKRPKNVSFSEDNGYWMPQGSRFEFKVCPRDSAIPTDWRHRWSRKWTFSLWPAGNVPGTWIWYADEEGVSPTDIHFWPSDGRPILACVYICPTESYKVAQHASSDHVQSGRKHSFEYMCTCLTWIELAPPRESKKEKGTRTRQIPLNQVAPRELSHSLQPCACPTSMLTREYMSISICTATGTGMAPSQTTTPASTTWRKHVAAAWDKRERLGEAKNPGPEPPREIWLHRRNGQRDPLRLCTQNGGWVWNMHYAPPLRVAKRNTPHEALRYWLAKHEPAIEPQSVEAARQLAQKWEEFPVPQPIRRTKSLPPRELEPMTSAATQSQDPPREKRQSSSQPEPLTRRRLRGKTSLTPSPPSPNSFCPADPVDDPDSQDSENRPEPYGCWDEIYDILRKPVLVDRNIPRELKTLWQRTVIQLLATEQSRTDLYPIASDLVFVLPKLVLSHPPGKEKGKARIHRIQECLRRASQGEWPYLIERVLQMRHPQPRTRRQPTSCLRTRHTSSEDCKKTI